MSLALKEAWKYQGLTYPNPAVGCCVVSGNGKILSVEAHKKAGTPHAEVLALQSAYYKLTSDEAILQLNRSNDIHDFLLLKHNDIFKECLIYTTLEPCASIAKTPACSNLLTKLKLKKVYIGSSDSTQSDFSFNAEFGVLKKECDDLLQPFNLWQKKNFVFFKWAQRLNGTTDDGVITSKETRKLTHGMRDVCDLLVVGGNTVRVDRPTLDARDVDGKASDILIYSRQKEFDKSAPLFNVKNRKVIISDSLDELDNYKNIMIEGTSNMYALTKEKVDYYLCYIAPKFGGNAKFETNDDKFEILNIQKEHQDIISWMKQRK